MGCKDPSPHHGCVREYSPPEHISNPTACVPVLCILPMAHLVVFVIIEKAFGSRDRSLSLEVVEEEIGM